MHSPAEITPAVVRQGLERAQYLTTPRVETVLYLALVLEKPLLIEGPAGAGKTEIGKVLAETLRTELVRLALQAAETQARSQWTAADQERFIADFLQQVQP